MAEVVPITAALGIFGLVGALPLHGAIVALALGGAMLGFAPFNRPVARLFLGEVDKGIGGLKRRRPSAVKAGAEIDNLITSLRTNRHRISYRSQRQGGYPLSSSGIESAHKFICHVRRNRSGAWWSVANGNHMLALHRATYNGTFDHVFGRYQQKILAQSPQKNVKK